MMFRPKKKVLILLLVVGAFPVLFMVHMLFNEDSKLSIQLLLSQLYTLYTFDSVAGAPCPPIGLYSLNEWEVLDEYRLPKHRIHDN